MQTIKPCLRTRVDAKRPELHPDFYCLSFALHRCPAARYKNELLKKKILCTSLVFSYFIKAILSTKKRILIIRWILLMTLQLTDYISILLSFSLFISLYFILKSISCIFIRYIRFDRIWFHQLIIKDTIMNKNLDSYNPIANFNLFF